MAPARVGDTLGYARVSTHDQNPDAQSDRLLEAGAIRVFTDIVSGKRFDRPALPSSSITPAPGTVSASFAWTGSDAHSGSYSKPSTASRPAAST